MPVISINYRSHKMEIHGKIYLRALLKKKKDKCNTFFFQRMNSEYIANTKRLSLII